MGWIRQKSEPEERPAQTPAAPPTHRSFERETRSMDKVVNIGKSVQIKGELTGNEDLTIEGRFDGKIVLKDHTLTIGANGHITAEINAKAVHVIGEVIGNITADDKVEVAATGSMQGDIASPRVVLADGARFKGSIDMEPKASMSSTKPMTAGTAAKSDSTLPHTAAKDRSATA